MQVERVTWKTICRQLPSCFAFDISKSGTGWATWDNEKRELLCGTFSLTDSADDLEMRSTFRKYVLEFFTNADGTTKKFEHYSVEDVIGSSNFHTANTLYQLNPIVDDMMYYSEEIPKAEIHRIGNTVWRKYLKALANWKSPINGHTDTKWIAQQCLKELGIPESFWANDNESDALGILLASMAKNYLGFTLESSTKAKVVTDIRKGHTVKQFAQDALVYPKLVKYLEKYKPEDIVRHKIEDAKVRDIVSVCAELIKENGNEKIYVIDAPSRALGVFLTHKNIEAYLKRSTLVLHHTSTWTAIRKKEKETQQG